MQSQRTSTSAANVSAVVPNSQDSISLYERIFGSAGTSPSECPVDMEGGGGTVPYCIIA